MTALALAAHTPASVRYHVAHSPTVRANQMAVRVGH